MSKNRPDTDHPVYAYVMDSLDKIDSRLDEITVVQAKQEVNIEHHIKRTDLLEAMVKIVYKAYQQLVGMGKLVVGAGILFAAVKGLTELLDLFK